jgi:hypothetical protein
MLENKSTNVFAQFVVKKLKKHSNFIIIDAKLILKE